VDDRVVGEERRQRILDVLTHQGFASLSEVMELTRASEATARRDLVLLERQGDLVRTRGGAKAISRPTTLEERFEMRRRRDRREKRLIAKLAAERIPDGATLFLNDGSSTYALAQSLLNRRLTVITSGLNIAQYLSATPATQVIVIGGSLRGTSFGTDGPLAVAAVTELHADLAVLGVDGITLEGGARANGLENAAVARAMKDHAARTIVLASPSKVGRDARMRIASWAEVDELVGASLPADFREALGAHGVNLVLPAGPD
jgi:DeoR/GlpR family transcriptional regulator of sugar metabolism